MSRLAEHDAQITAWQAAGKTVTWIANEIGVPRTTVRDYLASRSFARAQPGSTPRRGPVEGEVSELELVKSELAEYKRAANKERKTDVAAERRYRAIEAALADVRPSAYDALREAPAASTAAHHRHVLLLSDFHGGEVVNRKAVNGLNEYDWQIMEARVDETLTALLSHKQHSPELTGLDIGFLGDMCSGSNHAELAQTNQYPLAEQGVKIGYVQARIVERLVEHYADINVFTVPGNHPRMSLPPAAKNVHDNMDWVAGVVAKEYMKAYPTVTWTNAKSNAMIWTVAGLNYYVFHGDGIMSSMPGVPWGGVMRRANTIKGSYAAHPTEPVRVDGFYLGHFHQANAMVDLGIYMNGSLKGTDEWVLKKFGSASPPTQLLLEYDEKNQRQTSVKLITPTAGLR